MARNVTVDILRILFAFVIVFHHVLMGTQFHIYGYLAVDFFFIVSGYMVINSYRRYRNEGNEIGVIRYCAHKLMSFLPYLIFAAVVYAIVSGSIAYDNTGRFDRFLASAWFEMEDVFLVSMLGFYRDELIWYLSSLMICSAIIWFLLRRFDSNFSRYAAPIITVLLLIIIFAESNTISTPNHFVYGVVKKGLLRGLACMCLGVFAYECVGFSERIQFSKDRLVLGIIEIVCYLTVLVCILFLHPTDDVGRRVYDIMMIVLLFVALVITFSNRSIVYDFVQKYEWLGKRSVELAVGSLLLYLNHAYIIAAWNQWGPDNIILEAFVVVILAIIMSFLCYHAGKWIRKGIEYAVKEAVPSQS
ncbi:acyltransferase [Methanomethylophilus alvi]|uniref:acyltransferase n=1 Tax=Methanomethylophilus alvi TaxID=1291540 RepID=UPI0037DD988F